MDVYYVYRKGDNEDHHSLFGWTYNKSILKAFLKQRGGKYYFSEKYLSDHTTGEHDDTSMLQILKLKSCQTGDDIPIVTTEDEKLMFESEIQRYFDMLSRFDELAAEYDVDILDLVHHVSNLKDEYSDALHLLGYRPIEISSVYDTIEEAYSDWLTLSWEERPDKELCGPYFIVDDPAKIIIYSFESFVKVMMNNF